MSTQKHKPFHPLGLAHTQGGVAIKDNRVILIDPQTKKILRAPKTSDTPDYRDLYVNGKLFDLFPNGGRWYVAKEWRKNETFVIEEDYDAFVSGKVVFHGVPSAISWWDARRYHGEILTWDIQVDFPPDHRIAGDIAVQIALAGAIWELLEKHRDEGQFKTTVTNYFDKSLLNPLPYRVNRMGQDPISYLEAVYGFLWRN